MPRDRRHPFSRSYGASLPSSLARVSPTRLSLLSQGHLCRFSVRSPRIVPGSLFPGPGNRGNPPLRAGHSALHPLLTMTVLRGLRDVSRVGPYGPPGPPIPSRREPGFGLPHLPGRFRNINRIPFRGLRIKGPLRTDLPTADLQSGGTLALSAGRTLTGLCSYYRRDPRWPPVHGTSRPRFEPTATPPYRSPLTGAPGSRRAA